MKCVGLLLFVILMCPVFAEKLNLPEKDSVTLFLEHLKKISTVCESQAGISKDQLNLLIIGQFNINQPINMYCYISCVAKTLGLLNPDNTFNPKEMNAMFDFISELQESYGVNQSIVQIRESMNICIELQIPGDACEIAKNLAECINKDLKQKKKK